VFNQNYPAEVTLCEDVSTALNELLSELQTDRRDTDRRLIDEIRKGKADASIASAQKSGGQGVLTSRLLREVRNRIARETIFVTDCGNHQLFAITDFEVFEPRTFLTPSNYMAMGFGVPAAIGAALGNPDKKVVCLCGDGGFLISGFELLTAVREKLRLSVIICNDGALGLIKGSQKRVYGRTSFVDLVNPDYKQLADAFGVGYIEINDDRDLATGLERMVKSDGVVLVNVKVDYAQWSKNQKGMAKASWQRLPLLMKLNLLGRRAARTLRSINREGD
jgi:acetolactate synthase-1/2/3 large subunit